MPYGTISEDVKAFVEMRAEQGNVSDRIEMEPVLCETPEICDRFENCLCFVPGILEVSIIVGGALDEEFPIKANGYEANIADWISEYLFSLNMDEDYWVLVSDGEGNTVYTTENDFVS